MAANVGHLPGCYQNLSCERDESLAGYLLRVAEANGYAGIRELLRLVPVGGTRSVRTHLLNLYADRDRLAQIARIATGDPRHLQRFLAEPLSPPTATTPGEALYMQERRVDVDALLPARSPVCPLCLAEDGYVHESWDLAPVTVCVNHGTRLVDECASCKEPITWDRPHLLHCGHCAADLRVAETFGVSDATITVATHFEALAPFRIVDRARRVLVIDWEEMFHVFKALLLPDAMWAAGKFPASFASATKLESRHEVTEQLTATLVDCSYQISRVRFKVERALAPLQAVPIPYALADVGIHYLAVEAGISREVSTAICREGDPSERPSAAEVFLGRPPVLRTISDVERFLNATALDVSRLTQLGIIGPREEGLMGYDADHVLRARQFLDSLIDLGGLSGLVGVPVRETDLHHDGLFPRWNYEAPSDARVTPERVFELQREITARWHQSRAPDKPVALRDLLSAHDRAFDFVSRVVQHIIMGTIERFLWRPPFAWIDIVVCRNELRPLAL